MAGQAGAGPRQWKWSGRPGGGGGVERGTLFSLTRSLQGRRVSLVFIETGAGNSVDVSVKVRPTFGTFQPAD